MKYILVQTFMRLKTGQSPSPEQEAEVRLPVPSEDFDVSEMREMARDVLKKTSGAKFKSGWTEWMPRRQQLVVLEDEEPMNAVDVDELPLDLFEELDEDVELDEDGEPVPEYLSHEDWVGAQEASMPAEEELIHPDNILPTEKEAKELLKPFQRYKIKNVYDDPDFPHHAVEALQPDFEYVDWAEERVSQLWKRAK